VRGSGRVGAGKRVEGAEEGRWKGREGLEEGRICSMKIRCPWLQDKVYVLNWPLSLSLIGRWSQ